MKPLLIYSQHIYCSLSFALLIGGYRYLMQRFRVSDVPLVMLVIAFCAYIGFHARGWFWRRKVEGVLAANPRPILVVS